jgi:isopentenyl diphosphate isomerase/L-lactate dehydrogenase-like FMN-dependent dehydrogenase
MRFQAGGRVFSRRATQVEPVAVERERRVCRRRRRLPRAAMTGIGSTIRLLPNIARAVGDQVEVLLDDGVRRGGDVVKALALGRGR